VSSPVPLPPNPQALDEVAEILDPVLVPLGFAPGQGGASEHAGQVIFCRGAAGSADDGCVDLVVDLVVDLAVDLDSDLAGDDVVEFAAPPGWRITDVRYWGFASDRWHLEFEADAGLSEQLAGLALTLPAVLG
jgi:hypothetical protein